MKPVIYTLSTFLVGTLVAFSIFSFTSKNKDASEFKSGIIQVGVVVTDLQKSLNFYTDVLGMQKTGEISVNEEFSKKSGLAGGTPFTIQVLKLKDSPQATQWKLMSFDKTKASHPYPTYIKDDTGMQYITINVNSMAPFLKRIKKHNVKLLGDTPTPLGDDGRLFVLIQDPDGTFIELIGKK